MSSATRAQFEGTTWSTKSPERLGPMPEAPRGQTDVLGESGPALGSCMFDQLSWPQALGS